MDGNREREAGTGTGTGTGPSRGSDDFCQRPSGRCIPDKPISDQMLVCPESVYGPDGKASGKNGQEHGEGEGEFRHVT